MIEINFKLDNGIPQYGCTACSKCESVFGKSLCKVKNRGCCWYFPKFTLFDIHKMVQDNKGIEVLKDIINLPNVEIHKYYIHAKGFFDKAAYENYIKDENDEYEDVKDKTIFFRACPFIIDGVGCTLGEKYRTHVCNFFICDEIVKKVENNSEFKKYVKEKDSYSRWIEWENNSLQHFFMEKRLDLTNNLWDIVNILKEMPLSEYEYGNLNSIYF